MKHQNPLIPVIYYPQRAIRRRAQLWLYIRNGLVRLFTKPPVATLILLLLMTGIAAVWKATVVVAAHLITIPALVPVFIYTLRISLLLVVVLLVVAVLYLIGIPHKAREIENDLAAAFDITRSLFYRCPFLVACKPIEGTTAKEYVFWSRWINVEKWNRPETKQSILWALQANTVEDFTAGKGKYTITICAAPNVTPEERPTPQDPLFMS